MVQWVNRQWLSWQTHPQALFLPSTLWQQTEGRLTVVGIPGYIVNLGFYQAQPPWKVWQEFEFFVGKFSLTYNYSTQQKPMPQPSLNSLSPKHIISLSQRRKTIQSIRLENTSNGPTSCSMRGKHQVQSKAQGFDSWCLKILQGCKLHLPWLLCPSVQLALWWRGFPTSYCQCPAWCYLPSQP